MKLDWRKYKGAAAGLGSSLLVLVALMFVVSDIGVLYFFLFPIPLGVIAASTYVGYKYLTRDEHYTKLLKILGGIGVLLLSAVLFAGMTLNHYTDYNVPVQFTVQAPAPELHGGICACCSLGVGEGGAPCNMCINENGTATGQLMMRNRFKYVGMVKYRLGFGKEFSASCGLEDFPPLHISRGFQQHYPKGGWTITTQTLDKQAEYQTHRVHHFQM